jgi:hypothetical protein
VQRIPSSPRADLHVSSVTTPLFGSQNRSWHSNWRSWAAGSLAIVILSLGLTAYSLTSGSWDTHADSLQHIRLTGKASTPDVLVLYIYSNTDPEYNNNLKFFLREGVHPADGCEYLFIINQESDEVCPQACDCAVPRMEFQHAIFSVEVLCVYTSL